MLDEILKTTGKLKRDIEYKIHLDKICLERELLINIHCSLEDIERKIDKGVNPQITKYYEDYPMDDKEDFIEIPTKPYYMNPPILYNGKERFPQEEYDNVIEKSQREQLVENIKKIPNFVPYENKKEITKEEIAQLVKLNNVRK